MKNYTKKIYKWYSYLLILSIPIFLIFIAPRLLKDQQDKAIVIDYYKSIDSVIVNKLFFNRGFLELNGVLYRSDTINPYSKIYSNDQFSSILIKDFEPTFILYKKYNNDTIHFIKEKENYYLLIKK